MPDHVRDPRRDHLRADCANCFGLCCVVPAFSVSADFAIDKSAGAPCPNLQQDDFRCAIHTRLRPLGFPGCAVYDCFGAGQQVSQVTFGGADWRRAPATAGQMFSVFPVVRQLHELMWYLAAASALPAARPLHAELALFYAETERLTRGSPQSLQNLDVDAHRRDANVLLSRASELARARSKGPRKDHRSADLAGADLREADLSGASLRGASCIGADLRGADLSLADVTGADFRAADLRGADLAATIFLVQSQLDAAIGDADTTLSPPLTRPAHWSAPR